MRIPAHNEQNRWIDDYIGPILNEMNFRKVAENHRARKAVRKNRAFLEEKGVNPYVLDRLISLYGTKKADMFLSHLAMAFEQAEQGRVLSRYDANSGTVQFAKPNEMLDFEFSEAQRNFLNQGGGEKDIEAVLNNIRDSAVINYFSRATEQNRGYNTPVGCLCKTMSVENAYGYAFNLASSVKTRRSLEKKLMDFYAPAVAFIRGNLSEERAAHKLIARRFGRINAEILVYASQN